MDEYYTGTRLLSMRDINGQIPEIFMATNNRSAGKTTFFNRMELKRFLNDGRKFMVELRFTNELDDCANIFFKDIAGQFFHSIPYRSVKKFGGAYHELYADDRHCGYAVALNSADKVKKCSHVFSDVDSIVLDEFQSESGNYVPREIDKFISIHTSVARGGGKQCRYVPVYMLSNPVSILNPYFTAMGITPRLRKDTKFLRGKGYVLEQGFNDAAASAQSASAFNSAFEGHRQVSYVTQGVYLNDSDAFITKPSGRGKYVATILWKGKKFSILQYDNAGIMYVAASYDDSFPLRISTTLEDFTPNFLMLRRSSFFISQMRELFDLGLFRFQTQECREACYTLLAIY